MDLHKRTVFRMLGARAKLKCGPLNYSKIEFCSQMQPQIVKKFLWRTKPVLRRFFWEKLPKLTQNDIIQGVDETPLRATLMGGARAKFPPGHMLRCHCITKYFHFHNSNYKKSVFLHLQGIEKEAKWRKEDREKTKQTLICFDITQTCPRGFIWQM